jgi:hypothetical protein
MRTAIICAFVTAATTLVAAPQQTTYRPGDMTKPEVWVQNRGGAQAIPVELERVNTDKPLNVYVLNGQNNTTLSQPVLVRLPRQTWEYKSIAVSASETAANQLRAAGEDGWETTGIAFVNGNQATLLLKRLR